MVLAASTVVSGINGILWKLIILMIVFAALFVVWAYIRTHRELNHGGKPVTEENFDKESLLGKQVNQHHAPKIRKYERRTRRAKRLMESHDEASIFHTIGRWLADVNGARAENARAMRDYEMTMMKRMFFSPKGARAPRLKGDKIHHGISREGFGHRGISHQITNRNKRRGTK